MSQEVIQNRIEQNADRRVEGEQKDEASMLSGINKFG